MAREIRVTELYAQRASTLDVFGLNFLKPLTPIGETDYGYPVLESDYSWTQVPNIYFVGCLAQLGGRGPIEGILYDSQCATRSIVESILRKEEFAFVS